MAPAREDQEGQQCHADDPATDELIREAGMSGCGGGHIGGDRDHSSSLGGRHAAALMLVAHAIGAHVVIVRASRSAGVVGALAGAARVAAVAPAGAPARLMAVNTGGFLALLPALPLALPLALFVTTAFRLADFQGGVVAIDGGVVAIDAILFLAKSFLRFTRFGTEAWGGRGGRLQRRRRGRRQQWRRRRRWWGLAEPAAPLARGEKFGLFAVV